MNILFIGNSYTYFNNMPTLFSQLANSNGKAITVHSITKGGRRLEQYADSSDAVTIALDSLLSEETFDICFMQEQSVLPATNYDAFVVGLNCIVGKVKGKADRMILYATWGRQNGSPVLDEHNWTTETMNQALSDAYEKAAKLYGAQVSPAGNNFLYVTQNYPRINLYNEDHSHPSYLGSCLTALTHYYTVFREFPSKTEVLAVREDELSAFRDAVCR